MQYLITRLQDPHPKNGARLISVAQWMNRPESMKSEKAFMIDGNDLSIIVIDDVKVVTPNEVLEIFTADGQKLKAEYPKLIYVTEDQLERFSTSMRDSLIAKVRNDQTLSESQKAASYDYINRYSDSASEREIPEQIEIRIYEGDSIETRDLLIKAWGIVGKSRARVTMFPLIEKDPFSEGTEEWVEKLTQCDKFFPEEAPHRFECYFA